MIEDTKHESLYKPKYPHVGGERTGGELGAWVEGAKGLWKRGENCWVYLTSIVMGVDDLYIG